MAISATRRDDETEVLTAAINATPLVDVMLVLLIIFLITVPVVLHSVPVALPRERDQPNLARPQTIVLTIDKQGSVYWNDARLANLDALGTRFAARTSNDPAPEIQIRADRDARYEYIARVIDACRRAGVAKIAFVIEPEDRGRGRAGTE